jgi:transcription initiation factor TFIIB
MHNAMNCEASAGKNPMGLAAAVLYISFHNNDIRNNINKKNDIDDKRTQSSFAQAAGITDVTLRNTVRSLKNQLLLLN